MKLRKLLVITSILILSGCGTVFTYNNLDWLAHWYLDDYIELNEEQEIIFDQKLASWLTWHKQDELPKYLANLKELTADIDNRRLNFEKLTYHQALLTGHWQRIRAKLVPDLVLMASLLDQQQIVHLFKKLNEQNIAEREEIEAWAALSQKQQQDEAIKRYKKSLSRWLGSLTNAQEILIATIYTDLQPNDTLWLDYKNNYQAELKALFQQADRSDVFSEKLFQLLMTPEIFRSDKLNKVNDLNILIFKEFLLDIITLSTEQQRKHLINEINELAQDTNTLMQK